jgi:hypothetical protein
MRASAVRERLNSGILKGVAFSDVLNAAKTHIIVPVGGIVPVAIGAPQVVLIVVPRAATQHPLLRARTVLYRFRIADCGIFSF